MATTCKTFCVSSLCRRRKACACKCEAELTKYPALIAGCQAGCTGDPNYMNGKTTETLLCGGGDLQGAFNKFGYICNGFNPDTGTVQGQQYTREKKQELENAAQSMRYVWIMLGLLLIFAFVYFII